MENKRYSILFVALYCYTGHIKALINHLKKKNPLAEITLLTNLPPEEAKFQFGDYVNHLLWYDVPPQSHIKNKWLKSLVIRYKQNRFFAKLSKDHKYDIVNVHFPKWHLSYAYKYLRSMSKNLLVTPWGSDVLRIKDPKEYKPLGKLYRRADYIINSPTTPLGLKIRQEFKVNPDKFVGNFFGSDIIDYALTEGESISQEEAKKRFGIEGRYVITCGYKRKKEHRHKEIMAAIYQNRDKLPKNLSLLFPMTYGNGRIKSEEAYVEECKQECEKYGFHGVFVTDFLSIEDMYKLRKATDIFIHVQPTDASSGSLQEYILCDKKIIHGSWIKYEDLEAYKPLFYFPVHNLDELGEVIVKAYNSDKIDIPQGVIDYVKSSGWEYRINKMNEFYMSIV